MQYLKSIDLMQNTSPVFNTPSSHPTIKLPRMRIFKTGFRKLSILSKFWKWHIWQGVRRSSCFPHYDALHTKISMWLTSNLISMRFEYVKKATVPNNVWKALDVLSFFYTLSSPKPIKSPSRSISYNTVKIFSWMRRPEIILEILYHMRVTVFAKS